MENLIDVLNETKAPPCEVYSCDKIDLCAKEMLACKSFQFYVNKSRVVNPFHENNEGPNKEIYNKLYKDCDES